MTGAERVGAAIVASAVLGLVVGLVVGVAVGVGLGVVALVALGVIPAQLRVFRTTSPERVPPWLRR